MIFRRDIKSSQLPNEILFEYGKSYLVSSDKDVLILINNSLPQSVLTTGEMNYTFDFSEAYIDLNLENNYKNYLERTIVNDSTLLGDIKPNIQQFSKCIIVSLNNKTLIDGIDYSVDFSTSTIRLSEKPAQNLLLNVYTNAYRFTEANGTNNVLITIPPKSYEPIIKINNTFIDCKILNTSISSRSNTITPDFILQKYPIFASLIKSYIEYINDCGNIRYIISNFIEMSDVDSGIKKFVSEKQSELMSFLYSTKVDNKLLTKHLIEFYKNRGNIKSRKFLIRILTGVASKEWYPKNELFAPSASISINDTYMYVTDLQYASQHNIDSYGLTNFTNISNKTWTGLSSEASFILKNEMNISVNGKQIYRFVIKPVSGKPIVNETITDGTNFCKILPIATEIETLYELNNSDYFIYTGNGVGIEFTEIIKNGKIELYVTNHGYGYENDDIFIYKGSLFRIKISSTAKAHSFTLTSKSRLGYNIIQSGKYWQILSYVLSSEADGDLYRKQNEMITHPIGFQDLTEIRKVINFNLPSYNNLYFVVKYNNDIKLIKKILRKDIRNSVYRINWNINTSYNINDIIINGKSIYKVIDKINGEPSLISPEEIQFFPFKTSDGYTWQFLYFVDDYDDHFLTDSFIPLSPYKDAPVQLNGTNELIKIRIENNEIIKDTTINSISLYNVLSSNKPYLENLPQNSQLIWNTSFDDVKWNDCQSLEYIIENQI